MSGAGLPIDRDELRAFLKSISQVTGLSLSYFPPDSDREEMVIGESSFCLQMKANIQGAEMCRVTMQNLRKRGLRERLPVFDICHARMAELAVPLLSRDGTDLGSVMVGHALIHDITEEHKEHIRELAGQIMMEDVDALVSSAGSAPVFTRSRLEALGAFIRDQLLEKSTSRHAIEDTTEFLLQKYEELMFLYAVTETITPDSGHQKAFSVILDKGIQKLEASWGLLIMAGEERREDLELLETGGDPPMGKGNGIGEPLSSRILSWSGPALVTVDNGPGAGEERVLIVPFRVKNLREGYLVFGGGGKDAVKDADMRFSVALSRQTSSVLYAVQLYRELADLLFATLGALSSAIDAKDPYTHGHSRRVAEYAVQTARRLGYDSKFLTMLKIAGQLHDFGKIGVREHILSKQGRLDEREMMAMAEHPVIGAQILGRFKSFNEIVPGIRHHHERYDGTGYPDGIRGEDIPMVGRIIAVADAYDAMTSSRPYRGELGHSEALEELRKNAGYQFDPGIVKAFIEAVGEEKIG
jgi:HD-GYP domain-containing protein (c-di-GMP phosphodiesterase class II)